MRVLHYYYWGFFQPVSSGADVIAANQMEYFGRRGWDVDVLLSGQVFRAGQVEAFYRRYPWTRSVRHVDGTIGEFSFRAVLSAHQRIARSLCFRELAREKHDLFVANYVFAAPLVEPLQPGCLKVLEAHDIMTETFAFYDRMQKSQRGPMAGAADAFLWRIEQELYRLFDAVLFLNHEERRLVEHLYPGLTHTVPPMFPWEIATHRTVSQATATAAPATEPFDLIFVGSIAQPNVRGLTFFYREIFVPYLRKHQVRMAVAGRVCEQLDFEDWYVTKLGKIPEDLGTYYERSKLVVIPILEGSGISIKTIECLANGRAVVTTPVGARGLRQDPESFVELDMVADPRGTAQAILDLLASETKRLRMQRNAREYYRANFGAQRYFSAMDKVMESLGIPVPSGPIDAAENSPSASDPALLVPANHRDA
jgi:glycosyltransferase involved in cell wall biosynthesis